MNLPDLILVSQWSEWRSANLPGENHIGYKTEMIPPRPSPEGYEVLF